MANIDSILAQIQHDLTPQLEARLRAELATHDRDWLIEQIIRLSLPRETVAAREAAARRAAEAAARRARLERIRRLALDLPALQAFIAHNRSVDQPALIAAGHLLPDHPPKGTAAITALHRTPGGEDCLTHAKDVLFALLYGDAASGIHFDRCEREILTLTLPRAKAAALAYLQATTELQAHGTWQDPEQVSHDTRADNVLVQVEFGEMQGEWIGNGIVTALGLINNLEINEQILYAHMINVEQSTLIA
jgi:hypothetical protein